jgi:serine/threonine protein kinase
VKLCDFGTSRMIYKELTSQHTDKSIGTGDYLEKDLVDENGQIFVCKEMDNYSFGVLISKLIFNKTTGWFWTIPNLNELKQYSTLVELIFNCIGERKKRWSFEQILEQKKIILNIDSFDSHKKAADLGLTFDQFKVGMFYLKGNGVEENKELAMEYLKKSAKAGCFDAFLRLQFFELLEIVKKGGKKVRNLEIPKYLKDDKDVVLEAVKQDGLFLVFASDKLKDDKDVVLEAVKQDGDSLVFASDKLKDDKDVVLEAVKQDGFSLNYASIKLKDDKDVVLEAVKQDGLSLVFASDKLKDDKDVVLEAVKKNGFSLNYASNKLKDDKDIVLELVKQDGRLRQ